MILNDKQSLFGVVQKVDKSYDYTGVTSDTAKVFVDNELREIKVNVLTEYLLGDTALTAYPGYQGKLNRELITKTIKDLSDEISRATFSEKSLFEQISDVSKQLESKYSDQQQQINDIVDVQKLHDKSLAKLDEDTTTLYSELSDAREDISTNASEINQIKKDIESTKISVQQNLEALNEYAYKSADEIAKNSTDIQQTANLLDETIDNIDSNYATKKYVSDQLLEFNKIRREIAETVDTKTNTVVIEGETLFAEENVIYLVLSKSGNETIYDQYTLVAGKLTFIGSSKVDLSDYATTEYVDNKVSSIDFSPYATKDHVSEQIANITTSGLLDDYAKKEDLNDFITSIPEEYITSTELEEELSGYVTQSSAEETFATKTYVDEQLADVDASITKIVVDSVDLENNKVIVDGEEKDPEETVLYFVKATDETFYYQYTVVDGTLALVGGGGTSSGGITGDYATKEYVDDKADDLWAQFSALLSGIMFIDGGNAPKDNN